MLVRGAAPMRPWDLGLMFGAADLSSVRATERDGPGFGIGCAARRNEGYGARVGHCPLVTRAVVR